jgi:hypothetical protein
MKNICYALLSILVAISVIIRSADDETIPFVVVRVVNRGCKNDVEVFLKECFHEETGQYDIVREFTLAAPERKLLSSSIPGQEELVQWLLPSHVPSVEKDFHLRSRAITHHSTVYPYRDKNRIYLSRRKHSQTLPPELCLEVPDKRVKEVAALSFIWSISSKGKHSFVEVAPEGGTTIIPIDTVPNGYYESKKSKNKQRNTQSQANYLEVPSTYTGSFNHDHHSVPVYQAAQFSHFYQ